MQRVQAGIDPAGQSGSWSRRTRAPKASATGRNRNPDGSLGCSRDGPRHTEMSDYRTGRRFSICPARRPCRARSPNHPLIPPLMGPPTPPRVISWSPATPACGTRRSPGSADSATSASPPRPGTRFAWRLRPGPPRSRSLSTGRCGRGGRVRGPACRSPNFVTTLPRAPGPCTGRIATDAGIATTTSPHPPARRAPQGDRPGPPLPLLGIAPLLSSRAIKLQPAMRLTTVEPCHRCLSHGRVRRAHWRQPFEARPAAQ